MLQAGLTSLCKTETGEKTTTLNQKLNQKKWGEDCLLLCQTEQF